MRVPKHTVVILVILLTFSHFLAAYNIRQITNRDGLSNSAILSLHQDKDGFIWFGTVDGLNRFDGAKIDLFTVMDDTEQLSGNLIESLLETGDNTFWIHTNYGLDKVRKDGKRLDLFRQFQGQYIMRKDQGDNIYIVTEQNTLNYYNYSKKLFSEIKIENLDYTNILDFIIIDSNILQLFTRDGVNPRYQIRAEKDSFIKAYWIENKEKIGNNKKLIFSTLDSENSNTSYFIDSDHKFYEYDVKNDKSYYKYDLTELIYNNGEVSVITKHHNDYFVGFKTSGLIQLNYTPNNKVAFEIKDYGIRSGIFSILKDRYQDIVWIGTDGEGVYMYSNDLYSFKNAEYTSFAKNIASPTRSLLLDKQNTLWIGTKGDGIMRINNFDNTKNPNLYDVEYINVHNSQLRDNSVYSFAESQSNLIWIGSEEGLSYYSYADKTIRKIELRSEVEPIKHIHSICEFNDSTLWLATVGTGIVRARINKSGGTLKLDDIRHIKVHDEKKHSNYFYSIFKEHDRSIWFGNRGYGAYRIDATTLVISNLLLRDDGKNRSLNDIYAITKDEKGNMWFGTSHGLVRRSPNGEQKEFNVQDGFPNNVIHGILPVQKLAGQQDELWLSTNKGLIHFNIDEETFQIYSKSNGLQIIEYSDGAFYKDEKTNTFYFGGINGFTSFKRTGNIVDPYMPNIYLDKLSIYGEEKNITNYLQKDKTISELVLEHNEAFFSISFSAPDYINGNNYEYFYMLGNDNTWINNGLSNNINFTDLQPGKYNISVKYLNKITGKESPVYSALLVINPPWYLSWWMKVMYTLLAMLSLYLVIMYMVLKGDRKNKKEMHQLTVQHKEDSYESKLEFFTNIAHEFCTPLTLIYGPCNNILDYKGTDSFIAKNANIIQKNTERLNNLIQELIEFRSVDSGERQPTIEQVDVNSILSNTLDNFKDLIASKNIQLSRNIQQDMIWNSDPSFLYTIVTNLLSNAYMYTPQEGSIKLNVYVEQDELVLNISNTGKGLNQESLDQIFDRYSILDDLEVQNDKRPNTRNRLGLAISNSMVHALGGEIEVESILYDRTYFIVHLPFREKDKAKNQISESVRLGMNVRIEEESPQKLPEYQYDATKRTILIVDNDIETLTFVSDIFASEYNIVPRNSSKDIQEVLASNHPDIIICDFVLSSEKDIERIKQIKEDPSTAHIPLILMSAQYSMDEQIKSLDTGAEMFISKPFNIDYIRKSVKNLLSRKNVLKDYFNSPISAFKLTDNRLVHKEDSKFMQEILEIIEKNITEKDLSTKFIAEQMNISTRHLYRKLKETDSKNPTDIIRESRMHIARNLLLNTQLTVEEIMYKSGFNNKSTFFRQFSQEHDTTPQGFREQELNKVEGKQS